MSKQLLKSVLRSIHRLAALRRHVHWPQRWGRGRSLLATVVLALSLGKHHIGDLFESVAATCGESLKQASLSFLRTISPVICALLLCATAAAQDQRADEKLFAALRDANAPVVSSLLAAGANPQAQDADGLTALMSAARLTPFKNTSRAASPTANINGFQQRRRVGQRWPWRWRRMPHRS